MWHRERDTKFVKDPHNCTSTYTSHDDVHFRTYTHIYNMMPCKVCELYARHILCVCSSGMWRRKQARVVNFRGSGLKCAKKPPRVVNKKQRRKTPTVIRRGEWVYNMVWTEKPPPMGFKSGRRRETDTAQAHTRRIGSRYNFICI